MVPSRHRGIAASRHRGIAASRHRRGWLLVYFVKCGMYFTGHLLPAKRIGRVVGRQFRITFTPLAAQMTVQEHVEPKAGTHPIGPSQHADLIPNRSRNPNRRTHDFQTVFDGAQVTIAIILGHDGRQHFRQA